MNNDLISRSALWTDIMMLPHNGEIIWCEEVEQAIMDAPAVDAVEVVRCSECKHSAFDAYSNRRMCIRNGEIRPNCHIWFGTAVNNDHFCGYGVKKDADPPKSVT